MLLNMKMTKYMLAAAMMLCAGLESNAQDKVEGEIEVDLVSQYIWRGQDLGNVSIQPTLGIGWKGLSLSAWGSVGLTTAEDTKEFDLTLGYTKSGFNIGVTDYWFNSGLDARGRYFMYKSHKTNHVFEANVGYDFGFLSLQWFTNFAGNDGANKNGNRAYSSYFEISAPFQFVKCDWTATVGAVPYATDFYGTNGFAITNISLNASKSFDIKDKVTIPVFAGITANPRAQKAYFTVGFAIQPKL